MRFVVFFLLSGLLIASGLNNTQIMSQPTMDLSQSENRAINSSKDYHEIIRDMNELIKHGDSARGGYFLGMIYLTDFQFEDEVIKKDIKKAEKFFKMSLDAGNYVSAHHLAFININNNNIDEALFLIEQTIRDAKIAQEKDFKNTDSIILFLSTEFATIVLQYREEDKAAINKAIELLERVATVSTPSSLYILANLYNVLGNEEKSQLLLNIACKNSKGFDIEILCKKHTLGGEND